MCSNHYSKSWGPFKCVDAAHMQHHAHACSSGGDKAFSFIKNGDVTQSGNGPGDNINVQVAFPNAVINVFVKD